MGGKEQACADLALCNQWPLRSVTSVLCLQVAAVSSLHSKELISPFSFASSMSRQPAEELSDLPMRVAEITKEQRQRREREREEHRPASAVANGTRENPQPLCVRLAAVCITCRAHAIL